MPEAQSASTAVESSGSANRAASAVTWADPDKTLVQQKRRSLIGRAAGSMRYSVDKLLKRHSVAVDTSATVDQKDSSSGSGMASLRRSLTARRHKSTSKRASVDVAQMQRVAHNRQSQEVTVMTEYDLNSSFQRKGMFLSLPYIQKAARQCTVPTQSGSDKGPQEIFQFLEFGCSSGVNSILPIRRLIRTLRTGRKYDGPVVVTQTDLPNNDFVTLSQLNSDPSSGSFLYVHNSEDNDADTETLSDATTALRQRLPSTITESSQRAANVYVRYLGQSMYSQIAPTGTVNFSMAMCTLHFLSRLPMHLPNSIAAYIGDVAPSDYAVFARQGIADLTLFLRLRALEMMPGGIFFGTFVIGDPTGDDPSIRPPDTTESMAVGNPLVGLFNLGMRRAIEQNLLTLQEFSQVTLPIHFARRSEIDRALCRVSPYWKQMGAETHVSPHPAFDAYKEGRITREEYADYLTGFCRGVYSAVLRALLMACGVPAERVDRILTVFFDTIYTECRDNLVKCYGSFSYIWLQRTDTAFDATHLQEGRTEEQEQELERQLGWDPAREENLLVAASTADVESATEASEPSTPDAGSINNEDRADASRKRRWWRLSVTRQP